MGVQLGNVLGATRSDSGSTGESSSTGEFSSCSAGKDGIDQETPTAGGKEAAAETCSASKAEPCKESQPTSCCRTVLTQLRQAAPILTWWRSITGASARCDLVAGLTVTGMAIPQGLAIAAVAGVPYVHGLYSACVPALVYGCLGQSRHLAVGPAAVVAFVVAASLQDQLSEDRCPGWYHDSARAAGRHQSEVCPSAYTSLVCLTATLAGVFQVSLGLLKLDVLFSFFGQTVTSGFLSGAVVVIILNQLKYFMGCNIPQSSLLWEMALNVLRSTKEAEATPMLLGLCCLGYLVLTMKLAAKRHRLAALGPLASLVSCIVGVVVLALWPQLRVEYGVKFVGALPAGPIPLGASAWRFADLHAAVPAALLACLVSHVNSVSLAKELAIRHSYEVEAPHELIALGAANLLGGVFSCLPVAGSRSRSTVNSAAGARSQLAGLVTGVLVLSTTLFFTPVFHFLPEFALGAVVVNSIIPLASFSEGWALLQANKQDFSLWAAAFLSTLLFGVLVGISVSVLLSLSIIVYNAAVPEVVVLWRVPDTGAYRCMKQEPEGCFIPHVLICRVGPSLYFANAKSLKDTLLSRFNELEQINKTEYLVLDLSQVTAMDSSAVHALQDVVRTFQGKGIEVALALEGVGIERTMRKANFREFVRDEWLFRTVDEAVSFCQLQQRDRHRREREGIKYCLEDGSPIGLDVAAIDIRTLADLNVTNAAHASCTMVNLSLAADVAAALDEIHSVFKEHQVAVVDTEVESMDGQGERRTCLLRSARTNGKLTELEMGRLREALEMILEKHQVREGAQSASTWDSSSLCSSDPCTTREAAGQPQRGTEAADASRCQRLEQLLLAQKGSLYQPSIQSMAYGRKEAEYVAPSVDL